MFVFFSYRYIYIRQIKNARFCIFSAYNIRTYKIVSFSLHRAQSLLVLQSFLSASPAFAFILTDLRGTPRFLQCPAREGRKRHPPSTPKGGNILPLPKNCEEIYDFFGGVTTLPMLYKVSDRLPASYAFTPSPSIYPLKLCMLHCFPFFTFSQSISLIVKSKPP